MGHTGVMGTVGHGDREQKHTGTGGTWVRDMGITGAWGHRDMWAPQGLGDGERGDGDTGDRWGHGGHLGTGPPCPPGATFPQELLEQGHHVGVDDRLCRIPGPCAQPRHDTQRVPGSLGPLRVSLGTLGPAAAPGGGGGERGMRAGATLGDSSLGYEGVDNPVPTLSPLTCRQVWTCGTWLNLRGREGNTWVTRVGNPHSQRTRSPSCQ